MSYPRRVFVSFDGDTDIHYYRLMQAWTQSDNTSFDFIDAHDINIARDTSLEETIKRRLRERLDYADVVVSLIGANTRYLYKFVRWELEQSLQRGYPIVGVNLSGRRSMDYDRCPPILRDELVMYVSFNARILQHALENWPNQYRALRAQGQLGPYYYRDEIYKRYGL